jgi:N-acetylglucosaminyldiphosphoundecaprenol N-acetyl-beta-D-mannosaminyltransferase
LLSSPLEVRLLGVGFADLKPAAVLERLAGRSAEAPFAYVVTPNADHLVRLAAEPSLQPLYEAAWLRLLDSRVVARLARLLGLPAPPVVTGSDLTATIFAGTLRRDEPVTILGGEPEVVATVAARYGLTRIAHHNPPMGFDRDPAALEAALAFAETHPARFIFLAVGSPRQEVVAARLVERGVARGTGLCIGASLLFLAGEEKRAPRLLQQAGLEWAWRMLQDPKRLARRYLSNTAILRLLWEERRGRG